ncbi:hypothetical protein F511_43000 [Dorcoceras hygrometricum]|uniref:Uncharacterized protein n=1 Tax=Dorcoceras hygrometricum TaxID=472368 RepID=A0A2Z7AF78_9LAMI|nr:hypothetical protein F511_43000 [Dorcoceras hygrometricum]
MDFSAVLKNLVFDARSIFSKSVEQVDIHGKKRFMKHEYRFLNDILAKSITVKASSFDAVTNERFMMMTTIHFGLKVNWSKVLFGVLKDMVDKTQKKAKGYAAQIGVLLKSIPTITMGEVVPFPTSKILSIKTAVVKRKSKSKKKSSSADETPVEVISEISGSKKRPATEGNAPVIPKKRRTVKTKPSPSKLYNLLRPNAYQKRKLILSTGSDDETLDEQESVKETTEITDKETAVKHTDEVDVIIGQVLEETSLLTTDETEPDYASRDDEPAIGSTNGLDRGTGTEERVAYEQSLEMVDQIGTTVEADGSEQEVAAKNTEKSVGSKHYNEEQMSLDDLLMQISEDMMLPSITVAEVTKIRLAEISTHDKGKEPLEEDEPVKGNPARETVELICRNVDFLVQLRDQVMKDVVEFFHSFSLNKLSDLDALRDLKEKEKLMLDWAETDSLETVVRRKMYILAKYREMLLRKYFDSHRRYFAPGQPWTAMASQIIDLLSVAHSKSLEDLLAQHKEHGIITDRPSSSQLFKDFADNSCAVLAQFYSMAKSSCWLRPMILIDGTWTPLQGNDYCKSSYRLSLFVNRKPLPESVVEENFVPHVFFIEPVQYWGATPSLIKTWEWARVCTELLDTIDSDLVIYRTTLLRTFQVVTICRVDKSEVLVVLISPHDSKRH